MITAFREVTFSREELVKLACREVNWPREDVRIDWLKDGGLMFSISESATKEVALAPYEGYRLDPEVRLLIERKNENIVSLRDQYQNLEQEYIKMKRAEEKRIADALPPSYDCDEDERWAQRTTPGFMD